MVKRNGIYLRAHMPIAPVAEKRCPANSTVCISGVRFESVSNWPGLLRGERRERGAYAECPSRILQELAGVMSQYITARGCGDILRIAEVL